MRLHRLAVQAFGPFAGREEVDFDALAGSGLFLLHGPTGAGKTSVLDAVCFALYGVVPGARSRGVRLRSDHAAEGLAPEVACEFSVGPRRLEVTRSPAWDRPKRRGEGTTTEQAKVIVRELVDGAWIARTTRLDEAAHLLETLLGLGHEQFTKLVLLPQGDFAAFLRADAEARRVMLEKLFDTDRFSAVQQWLRDTATGTRREVDEARAVTRELLARADQAGSRLPRTPSDPAPTWPPPAVGAPPAPSADPDADPRVGPDAQPVSPRERVAAHLADALHSWEDATSRRAATGSALVRARTAHAAGADLARHQGERALLVAAAERLEAQTEVTEECRRRVRDAERALGVAPVAPQLTAAELALDAARERLDAAVAAAARDAVTLSAEGGLAEAVVVRGVAVLDTSLLAGLDDATVAAAAHALRERRGHLRGVAREAAGLPAALARARGLRDQVGDDRRALADAVSGAAALGPALAAETERLTQARALAATVPAATQALAAAEAVAGAVTARERLSTDLDAEQGRLATARHRRDDAREHWLDLREQRLRQMAAELAEDLADGVACPVCGSAEHPAPAPSGDDRVTEAAEQAARQAYDRAEAEHATREVAVHTLSEELARVTGAGGGLDAAQAAARHDAARAGLEAAQTAGDGLAGREDTVARLVAAAEQAEGAIEQERARLAEREGELAAAAAAAEELRARVDDARGDDPSLDARLARLEAAAERLEAFLAARHERTDALRAAAAARQTAIAAAGEAGFGDLTGALAAVLDEPDRLDLERRVRAHDSELAAVSAQLADPSLAEAAGRPAPDLVELASAQAQAQGDDDACAREIALSEEAVAQLREIEAALVAHLAVAEPLEDRYRTVADLARCADGTGGENTRRMSLSAYVLAARLEQVASAASRRLAQMSGGRYTLVHSDEITKGQRRAGLGLHVVDAWTGRRRDTTSLSGGESFYTSLALALGLADVVSAEAGGTAIETLFVDEGFGSLDEDTLEEVMDVLDGLRSGGRAVGLVSHVADLRQRIPAQIEVVKGRSGSHLSVLAGSPV